MSIQRFFCGLFFWHNFSESSDSVPSFAEPFPSPSSGFPNVRPLSLSGDPSSSSNPAAQINDISREEQKAVHTLGESERPATSISMLPDDVLLTIFDFYRKGQKSPTHLRHSQWIAWKWRFLVHVCHRWRQIVFASPCRLDLQIPCTSRTPVKKLGIWPAFPINVIYDTQSISTPAGEDNIVAALSHTDRVCEVSFALSGSSLRKMVAVMQEPFPMLRRLYIRSGYETPPDLLSAGFLGGSAPCLQEISICGGIPYPALPTLLLSTSDLVKLKILAIPSEGYISPEAMAASFASLPKLETFTIGFISGVFHPDRIRTSPETWTVLPALTSFMFRGDSEYIEDLVCRIDNPRLKHVSICYSHRRHGFQDMQLSKFLDRSVGHKLTKCRHAEIWFSHYGSVGFEFCHHANDSNPDRHLFKAIISYEFINWQVISQLISQFPAMLDHVVHLEIQRCYMRDRPKIEWSHVLRQFSGVQTLHVHREFSRHVALALKGLTDERATAVLPSLELICLEGKQAPLLDKFVAMRRCPVVTIVNTVKEFRERLESYIGQ